MVINCISSIEESSNVFFYCIVIVIIRAKYLLLTRPIFTLPSLQPWWTIANQFLYLVTARQAGCAPSPGHASVIIMNIGSGHDWVLLHCIPTSLEDYLFVIWSINSSTKMLIWLIKIRRPHEQLVNQFVDWSTNRRANNPLLLNARSSIYPISNIYWWYV